jgi:hypothetical protein
MAWLQNNAAKLPNKPATRFRSQQTTRHTHAPAEAPAAAIATERAEPPAWQDNDTVQLATR